MTEPVDEREVIRILHPREDIRRTDPLGLEDSQYPSLFEGKTYFWMTKPLEIRHTLPQLRFNETDQTAPAGRQRFSLSGGILAWEVARGTEQDPYSSVRQVIAGNDNNSSLTLSVVDSDTSDFFLNVGSSSTSQFWQTGGSAPFNFLSSNGAGSLLSRLQIGGAAATVPIYISNFSYFDMDAAATFRWNSTAAGAPNVIVLRHDKSNGVGVTGLGAQMQFQAETTTTEGQALANIYADWLDATHATMTAEMGMSVYVSGVETSMLRLMGNDVGVNIRTSTTVPTTATLAASHIRFVVDAGDQLVGYFNDAGTIRTFVVGTFL